VTSLELSKQLKEAGYPQWGNSFYWVLVNDNIVLWYWKEFLLDPDRAKRTYFTAPTVAELGERLPKTIKNNKLLFHLKIYYEPLRNWGIQYNFWHCGCESCSCGIQKKHSKIEEWLLQDSIFADTEANTRAKMWLYLKKEGLLTGGEG